jgi:O-acetylserine/cysteine efflux transporter
VALQQFRPLMLATLRFTLAALPWLFFIRRPAVPWRELAAYGVLVGAGQFGLLYLAMQRDISPGLASLVIQMQVFVTVGLAAVLMRERIRAIQLVALALSAAGLLLIALKAQQGATPRGLLLTVVAASCWGASNLLVKKAGPVNALGYVVWSSLFAIPPLLALTLGLEGWASMVRAVTHADAAGWLAVLWQALANSIFGYGMWSWLLARHSAATVTPTAMLVPIFGLGASAALLGEPLPAWKVLAAALVVAGLGVNVLWGRLRPAAPAA